MRVAQGWKDYELLDASDHCRLERWGPYILVRPDPVVVWRGRTSPRWDNPDAVYRRSSEGGGHWEYKKKLPDRWTIRWGDSLQLSVTPTGFKHTGVFPEQAANWQVFQERIRQADRPVSVLNLFAYTGAATAVCLRAGASVCHVDASKGMTAFAKRNIALNSLENAPVRFLVDDCLKFAQREIRRGHRYDAIILDPPSYGRGPSGETWKFEDDIWDFLACCRQLLSDRPLFLCLSSYTAGLSAGVMQTLCERAFGGIFGDIRSEEIGIAITATGQVLPCGTASLMS